MLQSTWQMHATLPKSPAARAVRYALNQWEVSMAGLAHAGLERRLFWFGLLQQRNREEDPGSDEREAANRSNGSEPANSSDRQ